MRTIRISADDRIPIAVVDLPPSFPALQLAALGSRDALVEQVRPRGLVGKAVMLVDEEGRLKRLTLNNRASALYGTHVHGQPIAGDAFIVGDGEDDWRDLPEEVDVAWITQMIVASVNHPEMFR